MKELASCQKRGCHRVQKARQSRLPGPVICWLRLLDQVSRLAAASTIPVTNAAMQENSKMSFRTLAMTASPYGSPPSAGHRRSWHHGQKVAELGQKCMPSGAYDPPDSHAAAGARTVGATAFRTSDRRAGIPELLPSGSGRGRSAVVAGRVSVQRRAARTIPRRDSRCFATVASCCERTMSLTVCTLSSFADGKP